jgi:hypothetical protein
MAGFTVADITNLAKEFYDDKIHDLIDRSTILNDYVTKSSEGWDGDNFNVTVHTGRNHGFGARVDDGTLSTVDANQEILPTAQKQTHNRAKYTAKNMYEVIKLTSPAVARLKSNAGALVSLVKSEVDGAMDDARKNQNRIFWGDGSGALTACAVNNNATVVLVNSAKHIFINQVIDIIDTSTEDIAPNGEGLTVTAVVKTGSAHSFSTAQAMTTSADEVVYLADDRGIVAATHQTRTYPWGLQALVSDTDPDTVADFNTGLTDNVGELDRAQVPEWQSFHLAAAEAGTITFTEIDEAFDKPAEAVGLKPEIVLTDYQSKRKYAELFTANRRYAPGMVTLQGGYDGLEFNGIGIFADTDASFAHGGEHDIALPTGGGFQCFYFLRLSDLRHLILRDWHWADDDGNRFKWIADRDAYTAYLRAYKEFATVRPNGMGRYTYN